jgi:hypothetical protein
VGEAVENEGAPVYGPANVAAIRALRQALVSYDATRTPRELDRAFAAAAAAIASVRGERADHPADPVEARQLLNALPELERLVVTAVSEMERAAQAGAVRLWQWFGLRSSPPSWNEAERSGARVIVASACAPLAGRGATWLRPRVLRLASERWAALLVAELRSGEEAMWERALGDRYESVRRRYAPRTKWHTGELSALLSIDERPLEALRKRLARWLADGRDFDGLPHELETAFVQTRTPARLA